MSRLYLLDSNVYIRAFRDSTFGAELQDFHRRSLSRMALSAVVAVELLIGAQHVDRERTVRRGLIDPFRARGRLLVPGWSTWQLVAGVDHGLRKRPVNRSRLDQRSFLHDMLIAATAREVGATVVTDNTDDFAAIARHLDFAFVQPFPQSPAV